MLSHRNAMQMRYATRLPLRPLLSVASIHGWTNSCTDLRSAGKKRFVRAYIFQGPRSCSFSQPRIWAASPRIRAWLVHVKLTFPTSPHEVRGPRKKRTIDKILHYDVSKIGRATLLLTSCRSTKIRGPLFAHNFAIWYRQCKTRIRVLNRMANMCVRQVPINM